MKTLAVELRSKHPHRTCWIHFEYPLDQAPNDIFAALENAGWERNPQLVPPLNGRAELTFSRKGSEIFAGWNNRERVQFVKEAKTILNPFGLAQVPHRKLALAELL